MATIQTQSGFALVLCQSIIGHSYTELRSRVFNFVTVISPYLSLMCNLEVLLPSLGWGQVSVGSPYQSAELEGGEGAGVDWAHVSHDVFLRRASL